MPPCIYIARHGETEANHLKYVQSQTVNEPLNETGISQAKNLGERLKNKGISFIATSPTKRTIETVNFVLDVISPPYIPVEFNSDFLEINHGLLDGMPFEMVRKTRSDLYNAWWGLSTNLTDRYRFAFPGGESFHQVVDRGKEAAEYLKRVALAPPYGNLLVVGHGGINTVIVALLVGVGPEEFFDIFRFNNCGLMKVDLNFHGKARIIAF